MEQENKPVDIAESPSLPVLTIILGILVMLVYYFYRSANSETWIYQRAFQISKVIGLVVRHDFSQLPQVLYITNFVTINLWHLLGSLYFLFLFGIPVEKRLGPIRFLMMVLLAATVPWVVQLWDATSNPVWPIYFEHVKIDVCFFGPAYIIFALAAVHLILVPQKPGYNVITARLQRKDRVQIFDRSGAKPVTEFFGLSANTFFCALLIYEYVQRIFIIKSSKDFDTIGLYASLSAFLIGAGLATFIRYTMQDTYHEHPLKRAAVRHYYELLDLDVAHDQAISGVAKKFGVPGTQISDWVKQNRGKLRPK